MGFPKTVPIIPEPFSLKKNGLFEKDDQIEANITDDPYTMCYITILSLAIATISYFLY